MPDYILAYDIGTSGVKASLFSEEGKLLGGNTQSYSVCYKNNTWAEQDPKDWWRAVINATKIVVARVRSGNIACVCFSGQMSGSVFLDKSGEVLYPAIIWADRRALKQAHEISARIAPWHERYYHLTMRAPTEVRPMEKIMWVKENMPAVYGHSDKVLCCKDYIAFRFTGNMYTDYSDASGTGLFDNENLIWSDEMFDVSGLDKEKMPEAVPSTAKVGFVQKQAAMETGLREGTPVVIGAGDGCLAALGARSASEGEMHISVGTSGWCAVCTTKPVLDTELQRTYSFVHAVPGFYVSFINICAAGASYSWLSNILSQCCGLDGAENLYDILNSISVDAGAGASGLIYLPYILGDMSLHRDSNPKGAFLGLNSTHTAGDLVKSVVEGVAYYLKNALDVYRLAGNDPKQLTLIGGALKGNIWGRVLCDVLGLPCAVPTEFEEAISIAAAVTGGVGIGMFGGFEVCDDFISVKETLYPDLEKHQTYNRLNSLSEKAFHALEGVNSEIARFLGSD